MEITTMRLALKSPDAGYPSGFLPEHPLHKNQTFKTKKKNLTMAPSAKRWIITDQTGPGFQSEVHLLKYWASPTDLCHHPHRLHPQYLPGLPAHRYLRPQLYHLIHHQQFQESLQSLQGFQSHRDALVLRRQSCLNQGFQAMFEWHFYRLPTGFNWFTRRITYLSTLIFHRHYSFWKKPILL